MTREGKLAKNKIFKIVEPILGYGLVAVVVLAVISVIAIFGGTIMRLFGFEYKSVGSIILFFAIMAFVGFPVDTFVTALPKVLLSLEKMTVKSAKILYIILDTLATAIIMIIVDYFMDSVSVTDRSVLIIAFVMAILSTKDIDNIPSEK